MLQGVPALAGLDAGMGAYHVRWTRSSARHTNPAAGAHLLLTSMVEEHYVAANLAAVRSRRFSDDELEEIRRRFAGPA